jgi:pentatricopeptide repeat protein
MLGAASSARECRALIETMRAAGLDPDAASYNALLKRLASARRSDAVRSVLKEMRRRGVSANAVTERIVRKALGEVGSGGRGNPAPGNRRDPAPGNPATVTIRHEPRRTEPRARRAERDGTTAERPVSAGGAGQRTSVAIAAEGLDPSPAKPDVSAPGPARKTRRARRRAKREERDAAAQKAAAHEAASAPGEVARRPAEPAAPSDAAAQEARMLAKRLQARRAVEGDGAPREGPDQGWETRRMGPAAAARGERKET